jgi:hypothetical protein
MPLLVFLLVVVGIFVVSGIWRYIRQEFQSTGDDRDRKRGDG